MRRRRWVTPSPALNTHPETDLITSAGGRLGRDSIIYGIGIGIALPFGLAGVAVHTRYLSQAEYGHLALLLVGSSLLTIVYNVPSLMGTIALAYGASGDEDVDDPEGGARGTQSASRETLTTGLCFTVTTAVAPTVLLIVFAPSIAGLVGGRDLTAAVRWAVLSAAAGSVYRLVLNIPRAEHRPLLYTVLSTSRPAFSLTIGTILVIDGNGPSGVLAGLAVGTALASTVTLLLTARSYARRFTVKLLRPIVSRSWEATPMIVNVWTLQNVDLLVLSRYASDAAVGNYRVANRLAAFALYVVSAFLMAMGPVQQSSLFKAAHDAAGKSRVSGLLVRYFAIGGIYGVLVTALSADALFLLAAPSYRDATPLVTLIAAGFVAFGLARVLARTAPIRRRTRRGIRAMTVAAVCFVPLCFVIIPLAGRSAAASSMLLVMLVLCAWWIRLISRAEREIDVRWRKVLTAALVAAACYGLSAGIGSLPDALRVAADATILLVVCPGLLVVSGAVPLRHARPLVSMVVAAIAPRHRQNHRLRVRIAHLDGADMVQLQKGLIISRAQSPLCCAPPSDLEHFVRVLRSLGDLSESEGRHDGHIGVHLVVGGTYVEAQARAESLRERGVDSAELYRLEDVFERARRLVPAV